MTLPVPSDPIRRLTHVAQGPVTYMDEGSGPVILLVHGLPGSARDFRYLTPELRGFRCIRVDLPGFGGTSRQGRVAWSLPERAALLREVLDELDIGTVTVVGHSMGGAIGVALATLAPERVSRVALLATPGFLRHRAFTHMQVQRFSRLMRVPGMPWLLKWPLRWSFTASGFPRSVPQAELLSSIIDAGMLDFPAHRERLHAITQPTLVAWATDDKLVDAAVSVDLAARGPQGPRLAWPTGGHNIQKTRAVELGKALSEFAAAGPQTQVRS